MYLIFSNFYYLRFTLKDSAQKNMKRIKKDNKLNYAMKPRFENIKNV